MNHLRARSAVSLLSLIRQQKPELFEEILEFRNSVTICPNETWDCCNCFNVGPLDPQGRCNRCGSEAVSPSIQKVN
jgi:uncharacterized paraquat-inducible protein A